jgi:hypothetical protein
MRMLSKAVPAVALALATAGCTSPDSAATSTPASSPSGATTFASGQLPPHVNPPTESSPAPDAGPLDVEPTPEVTAESDTITIAVDAVTAFCRPVLDYERWIGELYPFLTQHAAVAYETVDPANVPCTAVADGARVRDGDGVYTVRVLVPTDAGEYSVFVHRSAQTAPWGVEQITPRTSE